MFGSTRSRAMERRRAKAACHWPPTSQALAAALQLTTFGWTRERTIECSRARAACHWPPFSQALTAALQLM
eukprot:11419798-Alexandrium_andersonii.AAC.1